MTKLKKNIKNKIKFFYILTNTFNNNNNNNSYNKS